MKIDEPSLWQGTPACIICPSIYSHCKVFMLLALWLNGLIYPSSMRKSLSFIKA